MTFSAVRAARWLARSVFCLGAVILSQSARAAEPPLPVLLEIAAGAFIAGSDRSEREAAYELDTAAYGSPVTREQGWRNGKPPAGRENHPVVLVDVSDAEAYAQWLTRVTGRTSDTLLAKPAVCGRRCDAPAPAPEGSAPPRRGRTSDTLLAKPAVCGRRCDAPAPAPEGSAPPRRGRTSDTLLAKPAVCGRRCDAPAPAPEGSAPPRRGRTWCLPTELEWEKAARGTEGRRFPWGNAFDARRLNSADRGPFDTPPVGRFPDGASPYGMLDAAGEVFEWTATQAGDRRVVKGGSWDDRGCGVCRPAARHARPAQLKHILIGFRLVRED